MYLFVFVCICLYLFVCICLYLFVFVSICLYAEPVWEGIRWEPLRRLVVGNHSSALSFLLAATQCPLSRRCSPPFSLRRRCSFASWAENGVEGISFPRGARLWNRFSNSNKLMTQFAYLPKHLYSKYPLNTTNIYILLTSVIGVRSFLILFLHFLYAWLVYIDLWRL